MTEKMLALKCLFDHAGITLSELAAVLDIPEGRAFALLGSLVRDGDAVKERRDDVNWFTTTPAGEEKVTSWLLVYRFPRLRKAGDA